MEIFRHSQALPARAQGLAIAIGNFDGLHLGHRALLEAARSAARDLGTGLGVLTFEPHPRQVFQASRRPFRLTNLRSKAKALEAAGVDCLFVQHFDLDFAKRGAEDFVEETLRDELGVRHVAVGRDFHFGHKRSGDVALLRVLGARHGFGVTALDPVLAPDGLIASSSRVRDALLAGDTATATRLLGRPWEIEGRVEHGAKRGRAWGFPTANIALGDYLEPAHGIYAIRARLDDPAVERPAEDRAWWEGVGYIGTRPAVQGVGVLLEVHLFDRSEDLYGRHLRVQMLDFLRADRDFENLEDLKRQIEADCRAARLALANAKPE